MQYAGPRIQGAPALMRNALLAEHPGCKPEAVARELSEPRSMNEAIAVLLKSPAQHRRLSRVSIALVRQGPFQHAIRCSLWSASGCMRASVSYGSMCIDVCLGAVASDHYPLIAQLSLSR